MTRRKRLAVCAAMVVSLYARSAGADDPDVPPPWHFRNGGTVTTPRGTVLELPPGYYLAEPTWSKLDTELQRAQNAETRLKAENESLRASAREPGIGTATVLVGVAFVVGMIAGVAAY